MNNIHCNTLMCDISLSLPPSVFNKLKIYLPLVKSEIRSNIVISVQQVNDKYNVIKSNEMSNQLTKEELFGYILECIETQILLESEDVIIHCSAVERNGKIILFSGGRNSGKSTALINMLNRGTNFFADDFVYLKNKMVKTTHLPIKVREKKNDSLKIYLGDEIKYILPKRRLPEKFFREYHNLSMIIFPKFNSRVDISIRKISSSELFDKLIENCKKTISMKVIYQELTKVISIPAYVIEYSSTYSFNQIMDNLIGGEIYEKRV